MFTLIRNTDTCVNSYSHSYESVDWAGLEKKRMVIGIGYVEIQLLLT